MRSSIPAAPTVGEIARRLGEPVHRIEYVIRSRDIQPAGRAESAYIYTEADVRRAEVKEAFQQLGGPDYRFKSPKQVMVLKGLKA